jgi:hypothetical protein
LKEIAVEARFLVCPIVWNLRGGMAVALFLDPKKGEAVIRSAPSPPEGGWRLFPMSELEVLAWIREQQAEGISLLLLDPELHPGDPSKMGGYILQLADLQDSGKTLALLRELANSREAGNAGDGK